MLTMFNRRELCVTHSLKTQAKLRDQLDAAGIDHRIRAVNRNSAAWVSSTRARTGTFGQQMDSAYEYHIYVHKDVLDYARHVTGR